MRFVLVVLAFLSSAPAVFAGDYGVCANNIADEAGALVAPVVPAKKTMVVTDEVAVVVVKGWENADTNFGDSVHGVFKMYEPKLYAALSGNAKGVWVGVVEGIDGNNNPSLWLHGWIATENGCVTGTILERIYAERGNAPNIFWKQVQAWEDAHPEADHLIHTP